jgi:hypothetical protein
MFARKGSWQNTKRQANNISIRLCNNGQSCFLQIHIGVSTSFNIAYKETRRQVNHISFELQQY